MTMAMMTSFSNAIAAYSTVAKSVASGGGVADTPKAAGSDFASLLKDGAKAALETGKKSEEMSKQAMTGQADVRDVVAAVNNAELTLQTVVAVRDKVISAYNDILKMPI
jgi:flagellar hook-basal body complex protein FliE